MTATRKVIERVSARVFCHMENGGNPVTIFSSTSALSANAQQRLAQGCDWESVMVERPPPALANNKNLLPKLSFYMPSGEQVSFCAHAAMGAALELSLDDGEEKNEIYFTIANNDDSSEDETKNCKQEQYHTVIYDADIVAMDMAVNYLQSEISQPPLLFRLLRDYLRIEPIDLASISNDGSGNSDVIICNASVARPKTLVPLKSIDLLQNKAIPPKPSNSKGFELSCNALDGSTGIYLYAKSETEDGAWECRQFPRSSGYPEDPATGIAAVALACHLYHQQDVDIPSYKMYQGTAMGKPSLMVVDELHMKQVDHDTMHATLRLLGRVEIDERETMEITDDA